MEDKNKIAVNDELLVRYLAGEANSDEAEALYDWLTIPDNVLHFEKLQTTWHATFPSKKPKPFDKEKAWNALNLQPKPERPGSIANAFQFTFKRFPYQIAASLAIVFSCSILGFYFLQKQKSIPEITFATKEASQTLQLPDNSSVVLNRNSTLVYPEKFGEEAREVNFSGEAFFRVKADAQNPFIIHTAIGDIRVVGTAFNVMLKNDQMDVSVEEGKVLVYTSADSSYLASGHVASLRSGIKTINVTSFIDKNSWGYATHKFVFQDAPLDEVFDNIEKAYPYSIEIVNKDIKNCKLTASFDNVSAREMLNLIGETLDLSIQENDNTFRVEGKGCPWDQ